MTSSASVHLVGTYKLCFACVLMFGCRGTRLARYVTCTLGKKGKNHSLNMEAQKIMEKYCIALKGGWAVVRVNTACTHKAKRGGVYF